MNRKILNVVLSAFLLVVVSCSTGDSPESVAEKFLKEVHKMQFDEAKKYSTQETAKMLEMMSSLMLMSPGKEIPEKKFTILEEDIKGDVATVKYQQEGKEAEFIKLVKRDGKWLVSVSKEDITSKNGGAHLKVPKSPADSSSVGASDSTEK